MIRLAVVAGGSPGHAFPAAALATALAARGHEVSMFTAVDWADALRQGGVAAESLPELRADPRDADLGFRLWDRAAETAPALARQLAETGCHAVVADTLTFAGALAAGLLGRQWLELIPHRLQDPSAHLPAPGTGLAPGRRPPLRARDAVLRRLHERSRALGLRQRTAAARRLGLAAPPAPVARLVATLPALEPRRPDWPVGTFVVGPLEWDPAGVDLALPDGAAPLVLLSESSQPGSTALAEPVLAAAGRLGLRVAWTTFGPTGRRLPAAVSAGPGRQAPLLAAASLVVTGGGHGMLAKALGRGLPVLAVPGGGDQYDNAMQVRRLGAGLVLLPRAVTPRRVARAMGRVLDDPSFRRAALRAGHSAAGLGPGYAAWTVEQAVRRIVG